MYFFFSRDYCKDQKKLIQQHLSAQPMLFIAACQPIAAAVMVVMRWWCNSKNGKEGKSNEIIAKEKLTIKIAYWNLRFSKSKYVDIGNIYRVLDAFNYLGFLEICSKYESKTAGLVHKMLPLYTYFSIVNMII